MPEDMTLFIFLIVSAAVMITGLLRHRIVLRGALLSAGGGLLSLGAVSLLSASVSLGVSFNLYSALLSVIYGLPGVVGMLVLRMITG